MKVLEAIKGLYRPEMASFRVLFIFLILNCLKIYCEEIYKCETPSIGGVCRLSGVTIESLDDIHTMELPAEQQFVQFVDGAIPDFGQVIYEQLESVTNLTITNSGVKKLFVAPTLVYLNASMNNLTRIERASSEDYSTLRVLILSHNAFDRVPNIKDFVAIETLDLSDNKMDSVNLDLFSRLTKLRELDLSNNKIRFLDTENGFSLRSLTILELRKNHLFELDLTRWKLPALRSLHISLNFLSYINGEDLRQAFPKLSVLGMSRNQWNCRCLSKLTYFLEQHSISFTHDDSLCLANYTSIKQVCCLDSYVNYVTLNSQRDIRLLQREMAAMNTTLVVKLAAVRDEQSVQIAVLEQKLTVQEKQMALMKDHLTSMARLIDDLIEELYLREMEGEDNGGISRKMPPSVKVVF
ncbi:leucine-rich repeats and immunoglobulin-like domains protein sma-10 [Toxorhynchites rutilus septentrionalis]|uniref:leucine-rich repeats and immunoglobulin-like domains protein sma-10 n=1 Tax=Toxorhynchites rutilus septentrionalis TaxID=329112 RepID=UPI00247A34BF|nr:leucine-rich repeats and immunoglobulin-like domains protein sma-10 [Toxorhynchites rutilus septentrionalis]